jgi:hypothetical protein
MVRGVGESQRDRSVSYKNIGMTEPTHKQAYQNQYQQAHDRRSLDVVRRGIARRWVAGRHVPTPVPLMIRSRAGEPVRAADHQATD